MFKNYFKVALRSLRKSSLHSFITVSSLAIGIAASLAITLFIRDELSFDNFDKKENIFRLNEIQSFTGTNVQHVALSMPGMGPAMLADYPSQVINYTRFWDWASQLISHGDKKMIVEDMARVDSSFFDIFDYPVLLGDSKTFLDEPNTIVLRENIASALFGTYSEAMGNMVEIRGEQFKVTGILPNQTPHSHLQFQGLASINTWLSENPEFNDTWGSNFLNTYLLLNPDTDLEAMATTFPEFLIRHTDNEEITDYYKLYLQQLSDVHLQSMNVEHDYNNYRKFNGAYLDVFAIIAVVILIIAAVNFTNLSIARAGFRWKEVGVRKSIGAQKKQLFIQFMIESLLLSFGALILALLLLALLLPMLAESIGRSLTILSLLDSGMMLLLVFGGTIVLSLVSGIYPSIYISSLGASRILKGSVKTSGKPMFRNVLIVTQYSLAVAMIIGTIVVLQQLNFMKNTDVGYDIEQMMLVSMNSEVNEKYPTLKNEILKSQYVEGVTATGQRMGNNMHQYGFKVRTDTAVTGITPSNLNVDIDFFTVYGIEMLEGRGFSADHPTDTELGYVINEELAKDLGLENPTGMPAGHSWLPDDSLGSIIGVTRNFNFNSLHFDVNTLAISAHPDWGFEEMTVKINSGDLPAAIADVRRIYETVVSDWPFTYSFLDEHFESMYRSDQQMSTVVSIMAGLAIFIACMGLFGLAQIESQRRTKEVGIRKVLGASGLQIMSLLSRNFTILILIAFLIAAPVAWVALSAWLENFAFRITLEWWVFPVAAILSLLVAILTIAVHAYRSASLNPADSLRYE